MSSYRTSSMKKVAQQMNFNFNATDEWGLFQMVKDCCIRPNKHASTDRVIKNIIWKRDVWNKQNMYIFDFLIDSINYSKQTFLLLQSTSNDFPFLSAQPISEIHPPRQRILKKRRKRKIVEVVSDRSTHHIYTTNLEFYKKIKNLINKNINIDKFLFLELHNFYMFYSIKRTFVRSEEIDEFYDLGLELLADIKTITDQHFKT